MPNRDYQDKRLNYQQMTLDDEFAQSNPFTLFQTWIDAAFTSQVHEPNAMTLATVDAQQQPHARVVLLKSFDTQGFVFYTNYDSAKGKELTVSNKAALNFYWPEMERQVRLEGLVSKIDATESDEYFQNRPRASQVGAFVSRQSQPLANRAELDKLLEEAQQNLETRQVPRPQNWGGYRLTPASFEFWQGRPNRLHDRIKFIQSTFDPTNWTGQRLFP